MWQRDAIAVRTSSLLTRDDGLSPCVRHARHTVIMDQQVAFSLVPTPAKIGGGRGYTTKWKSSREFQDALWRKWPAESDWPGRLDVYEAAAYCRVSPDLIRDALTPGRDGRSKLAHKRIGVIFRIRKIDLDNFGQVLGR